MPWRDPLSEAQSAEVQRRAPWDKPDALRPWDARLVLHAKRGTRVLAALAAFLGGATAVGGWVAKGWRWLRRGGETAPAELPKTGQPTIATDFVAHPPPPPPTSRDR